MPRLTSQESTSLRSWVSELPMEIQGLVIFVGIVAAYSFVLLGCMARRLDAVGRQIEEEDAKYVN